MKKIILFIFLIFSLQSFSQIAFYKVSRGDVALNTSPRFSVDIGVPVNIVGPWAIVKSPDAYIESGLFVTNNGMKFDEGAFRHSHRALGLSLPIRVGKIIASKYYLGTGMNMNFNFHHKYKTYDYGTKNNKQVVVSEFFSKQINVFYPSVETYGGISVHGIGRLGLRAQIFPMSLLNPAYSTTENGIELRPYEGLATTQNFRILISYNPGL